MDGEIRMSSVAAEVLTEREQLWAPASLEADEAFCADDRSSDESLKLFGGTANIAYALQVLQEATQPGAVTTAFEDHFASLSPVIRSTGLLKGGIHSDEGNEGGNKFQAARADGGLGCKWLEARQAISKLISDERLEVISKSTELFPEIFDSEQDKASADAIASAHGALAEREGFLTPGRSIAAKAVKAGTPVAVLPGSHSPDSDGIVNTKKATKFASRSAMEAGKPAYSQDVWAAQEAFDNLRHIYPYDTRAFLRAEVMDTVATMFALGISKDRIVRR